MLFRRQRQELLRQPFEVAVRRQLLEAVDRRGGRPGKLLARPRLDERRESAGVVEHRRTHVDERVDSFRPGEHPAHAVGTEVMPGGSVQAADDGLALGDLEALARNRGAQGERTGGHPLTARAMTSHGEQRRRADPQPHPSTPASTFRGKLQVTHNVFLSFFACPLDLLAGATGLASSEAQRPVVHKRSDRSTASVQPAAFAPEHHDIALPCSSFHDGSPPPPVCRWACRSWAVWPWPPSPPPEPRPTGSRRWAGCSASSSPGSQRAPRRRSCRTASMRMPPRDGSSKRRTRPPRSRAHPPNSSRSTWPRTRRKANSGSTTRRPPRWAGFPRSTTASSPMTARNISRWDGWCSSARSSSTSRWVATRCPTRTRPITS